MWTHARKAAGLHKQPFGGTLACSWQAESLLLALQQARSKASQSWRSGMEDMLGSASAPQRLEEQKVSLRRSFACSFV